MKKDNKADIRKDSTKINVPNIIEKSEPIFKKPFAPPLSNNNNQLVDDTIKQSDYAMDFNIECMDLDIYTACSFRQFFYY